MGRIEQFSVSRPAITPVTGDSPPSLLPPGLYCLLKAPVQRGNVQHQERPHGYPFALQSQQPSRIPAHDRAFIRVGQA